MPLTGLRAHLENFQCLTVNVKVLRVTLVLMAFVKLLDDTLTQQLIANYFGQNLRLSNLSDGVSQAVGYVGGYI
nr:hypothetical protein [Trichoderma harzianum]